LDQMTNAFRVKFVNFNEISEDFTQVC
jgi:hypothetical protein